MQKKISIDKKLTEKPITRKEMYEAIYGAMEAQRVFFTEEINRYIRGSFRDSFLLNNEIRIYERFIEKLA